MIGNVEPNRVFYKAPSTLDTRAGTSLIIFLKHITSNDCYLAAHHHTFKKIWLLAVLVGLIYMIYEIHIDNSIFFAVDSNIEFI